MSILVKRHDKIIPIETIDIISTRYKTITQAVNEEFWNSSSDTQNSIYVGSYGRGTAVNTSDVDILVLLPEGEYSHYNITKGNGQSRLLQAVRQAIIKFYPRSEVKADGQVVKILFSDDIKFEILPAFKNWDSTYRYPDSHMGGKWCSTNPKAEQEAMRIKNKTSNGLLFDTCKHIRYVRDEYFKIYHLSGIVIDSFVYYAMGNYEWSDSTSDSSVISGAYETHLLNYFNNHSSQGILAPGSNQHILISSSIDCLGKVLNYIAK